MVAHILIPSFLQKGQGSIHGSRGFILTTAFKDFHSRLRVMGPKLPQIASCLSMDFHSGLSSASSALQPITTLSEWETLYHN